MNFCCKLLQAEGYTEVTYEVRCPWWPCVVALCGARIARVFVLPVELFGGWRVSFCCPAAGPCMPVTSTHKDVSTTALCICSTFPKATAVLNSVPVVTLAKMGLVRYCKGNPVHGTATVGH